MWLSRMLRWSRTRTATALCRVLVVVSLGVPCANAHTLSVTQGTATIEEDVLTLRFTVVGGDLLHDHLLGTQDDATFALRGVQTAAVAYGAALLERIVVRGERGETISGRIEVPALETATGVTTITAEQLRRLHVGYTLSYSLVGKSGHIALQQTISEHPHAAPSQIVLAVRSDALPPQTIRLTGGGNIEIVPLTASPRNAALGEDGARGDPCARCRFVLSDAHRTVRAVVHINANGARVELYLPAQIIETWIALPRAHRDYFEPNEQDRVLGEVRRFLTKRNRMHVNGQLQEPRIDRVAFLDVGDCEPGDEKQSGRASSWTSRIYASIRYPSTNVPREVDLHWDLFNSVVLAAQILVVADSDCRRHDISTYRPHLEWRRD